MRGATVNDKRQGRRLAIVVACALPLFDKSAWAGQFSISKSVDATIDTSAYMANSSAPYGRSMNGNSFETDTLTTLNGYQYTAYWKTVVTGGVTSGDLALARRPIGSSTWTSFTLTNTKITNGPNDAHDIASIGIDPKDGTVHVVYDLHDNTLRYLDSSLGAATNPATTAWTTSLFSTAEQSTLLGTSVPGSLTYPMFVRTPSNDLQLFMRSGGSGDGSWFEYTYNGTSHTWGDGHQIDSGTLGTAYVGTTTTSSPSRNDYPNGFTYGANGQLYQTFTYRESATGAANHDLMYVYSTDGGDTWKNNAGTIVSNASTGLLYNINSPGLVVRPLPETQTNMNQQGQAVDSQGHIHAIGWHRDSAKDPSLDHVWEPQESSYYDDWRDNLGNWHEARIPGDVGSRPKIVMDANDNAYAIYQVKSDTPALVGGSGTNGNLYFNNGDLVISAATKASNWTDWKVIKVESGPFVSEAQLDADLFASTGTLSIVMQKSPTLTGNQGTTMRSLDYSVGLTPATSNSFVAANGDWSSTLSWSAHAVPGTNTVVNVNNGNTAQVTSTVPLLDNVLAIGAAGTAGTLNISGGSLNLLQTRTDTLSGNTNGTSKASYVTNFGGSIVVGRDGGAIGTYNQTAGNVSAWRFAVGDYMSETSGGGVSSATISGGTLTTYELDIAFSATGSSSGSSFTVNGGNVTINGDAIVGEFGNTGSLTLSSGNLTIAGNLREGFNQTNTSNLRMDGGTLDMTGGFIAVDNFIYNGGAIANVSTAPIGTNVNATAGGTMSGMTVGTALIGGDLAAGRVANLTIPTNVRLAASSLVETFGGGTLALGVSAAVSVGTTPSFTANQVNVVAGGTLAGTGLVAAPVGNISGVVAPGHSGASGAGTMVFGSTFAQATLGVTEIGLGDGNADQLQVLGAQRFRARCD